MLITVTEFFRDQHVFECLEDKVIPALFEGKTSNDRIRVWSVGCSTGEEAYSITILLLEELSKHEERPRLQVFASDLHERSLTRAREGIYPLEISSNVPAEWLKRYFVKENDDYRVRREVREMVVFAPHNLLGDPPFSHLDLIVCRNVMIYLQRDVQRDVIRLFHYALEPEGRLVLGTSETVDRSELFTVEDKQNCVYRRRNVPTREVDLPILSVPPRSRHGGEGNRDDDSPRRGSAESYGVLHERVVERYAPPSVLINADHEIVHSSTRAGRYMEIPGGEPTRQVFKLLREPLGVEVRAALAAARRSGESTRSQPVRVKFNGDSRRVVLHVHRHATPTWRASRWLFSTSCPNPLLERTQRTPISLPMPPTRRPAARWKPKSSCTASGCKRRSRSMNRVARKCRLPTRNFNRPTKNSARRWRNWRRARKNCNR
ncbi:MAG: protein-glutamate O-methyltransferase CheR [Pirellulaceae bacterium]